MLASQLNITRRQALSLGGLTLGLSLASAGRVAEAAPVATDGPIWVPTKLEWKRLSDKNHNNYHVVNECDEWGNVLSITKTMDDGWTDVSHFEYDQDGYELSYRADSYDTTYEGQWSYEFDGEGRLVRDACVRRNGMSPKPTETQSAYRYRDDGFLWSITAVDEQMGATTTRSFDDLGRLVMVERDDDGDESYAARKSVAGLLWRYDDVGRVVGFIEVLLYYDQQDDGTYAPAGRPSSLMFDVECDEYGNIVKVSEEANEWTVEYVRVDDPSPGARLRAMEDAPPMSFFIPGNATPYAWDGHKDPSPDRKLVRFDASDGGSAQLRGKVCREDADGEGPWVFYLLKLDNPVEFTGLDGEGPATVKTDRVMVAGAVSPVSLLAGVPADGFSIPEWEERVGKRVTCHGKIVGKVNPHYSEVNMVEAEVQK